MFNLSLVNSSYPEGKNNEAYEKIGIVAKQAPEEAKGRFQTRRDEITQE